MSSVLIVYHSQSGASARLARSAMLNVLEEDYVRTARAKGLPERRVILRHALKGALLPVVSFLGPAAAGILTGSLVIEKIFAHFDEKGATVEAPGAPHAGRHRMGI